MVYYLPTLSYTTFSHIELNKNIQKLKRKTKKQNKEYYKKPEYTNCVPGKAKAQTMQNNAPNLVSG